ncbi:hypothetical protein ILFOPFJJ_05176 [Ensifer psoraleae]|uniref:hypothetical protein n=1 Tax=Sinorhizobium psoraleae TaxID=520838 RepID=UPI0015696974|nr:hypothetical protein [Sinorhizobium psoraleae]NRP74254.1 hypothetical protein [Sinorhizobium psoraleae]
MTHAVQSSLAVAGESRRSICGEATPVPSESDEIVDPVLLAGIESFPASEPPSGLGTTAGAPGKLPTQHGQIRKADQ